ncbi:MAG TPA: hypothetical protein PKY56_05705 [Candidatus Kapabacteria bacterium]|nr:hypothetical protein [Candidatus Kapabacteria bacterium]HPO63306.1 hypothetical protein [Candidatus Kapabacteria bacterium]
MEKILSIHFGTDRVYSTLTEFTDEGLELHDIASTDNSIDLENFDSDQSQLASQELEILLSELAPKASKISITLPSEEIFVTQIPGKKNISENELRQLIGLEIRQAYPNLQNNEFSAFVTPLKPKNDSSQNLLATIINKSIIEYFNNVVAPYNIPIENIDLCQLNAHNSFFYNYPEEKDKPAAFFDVQKNFVDISLVADEQPAYYNVVSMNDPVKIASICDNEISKFLENYVVFVDNAFFFGNGLTKEIFDIATNALNGIVMQTIRFNPFRMVKTSLDKRHQDYCSRSFHIYPSCIGASIKPKHTKIKVQL